MSSTDVKSMGRALRQIKDPNTSRLFKSILNNIETLTSAVEALENPDSPGWINLKILNSWVQATAIDAVLPKYFKNKFGQVFIRGVVNSGTTTTGTLLFELPKGYRPSKVEIIDILEDTGSGDAHFHIAPDGKATIEKVTSNAELSINCSFFAEN